MFRRIEHTNDSRDAVFSGDDGAVCHDATDFHDEGGGVDEKRGPAGIGEGGNEDFAGFEPFGAKGLGCFSVTVVLEGDYDDTDQQNPFSCAYDGLDGSPLQVFASAVVQTCAFVH